MSGRNSPSSKRPVISVCVICFNQERYIADCIEGILAQNLTPQSKEITGFGPSVAASRSAWW